MTEEVSIDTSCPVFEVHRVASVKPEELAALSLSDIARKYTELVPVTSVDQLQKAKALAVVPPESMYIGVPILRKKREKSI